MTERLSHLPPEEFVAIWNSSLTLDEATHRVRTIVGTPCPRWAVMARAAALREDGIELKPFRVSLAKKAG